jgi:hypothetical protein
VKGLSEPNGRTIYSGKYHTSPIRLIEALEGFQDVL